MPLESGRRVRHADEEHRPANPVEEVGEILTVERKRCMQHRRCVGSESRTKVLRCRLAEVHRTDHGGERRLPESQVVQSLGPANVLHEIHHPFPDPGVRVVRPRFDPAMRGHLCAGLIPADPRAGEYEASQRAVFHLQVSQQLFMLLRRSRRPDRGPGGDPSGDLLRLVCRLRPRKFQVEVVVPRQSAARHHREGADGDVRTMQCVDLVGLGQFEAACIEHRLRAGEGFFGRLEVEHDPPAQLVPHPGQGSRDTDSDGRVDVVPAQVPCSVDL